VSDAVAVKRTPAVEGWFGEDASGAYLVGTRCKACGTYFFPKETYFCRNPRCAGSDFEQVALSRRGVLWSYTNNCYPPPHPFVASDPFAPYAIAAVELERERMVVLGQVADGVGVESLEVGMPMQLEIGRLFTTPGHQVTVWKWRPVA
jgi:hypothetical protein